MIMIDKDYLSSECTDNNLLIGYAYKKSTFGVVEKTLITLFTIGFLLVLLSVINKEKKISHVLKCEWNSSCFDYFNGMEL